MKTTRPFYLILSLLIAIPGFGNNVEDANKLDESFLHASAKDDIAEVESLLSNGVNVNAKDKFG